MPEWTLGVEDMHRHVMLINLAGDRKDLEINDRPRGRLESRPSQTCVHCLLTTITSLQDCWHNFSRNGPTIHGSTSIMIVSIIQCWYGIVQLHQKCRPNARKTTQRKHHRRQHTPQKLPFTPTNQTLQAGRSSPPPRTTHQTPPSTAQSPQTHPAAYAPNTPARASRPSS